MPRVRVHVKDAEGPVAQRLLVEGEADIAISVAHQDDAFNDLGDIRRDTLYAEPFDALVSVNHELARSPMVSLPRLANDPWITPWPGNPIYDLTFFACEEAGFRPNVTSVSDDFRAVCALVSCGAGVALAPRSALRGARFEGVTILPIKDHVPTRRVFVSVRRGTERHPLVTQVLSALHEHAAALDYAGVDLAEPTVR
jgi:DNA-binding transcriptional LysR family regulator